MDGGDGGEQNKWQRMMTMKYMMVDRGKGVPSFDEMVAIVLEEVDFDDLMRSILWTSPCQEFVWQVTRATPTLHTQR